MLFYLIKLPSHEYFDVNEMMNEMNNFSEVRWSKIVSYLL